MWIPEQTTKAQLSMMSFALLEILNYKEERLNMSKMLAFYRCFKNRKIDNVMVEKLILRYRTDVANVIHCDRNRKFTAKITRKMFEDSYGNLSNALRPDGTMTHKHYIRPFIAGDTVIMERNRLVSNVCEDSLRYKEFVISKIDYASGRVYTECGLGNYVPIHLNFLSLRNYAPATFTFVTKHRAVMCEYLNNKD